MTINKEIQTIKDTAVKSAKWSLVGRASQVLGGSVMFIALPFWLAPDDFGIITMFTSVLALVMIVHQAGLMEAVIQREQDAEKVRDAAFWLSIIISIVLYIIVYFSSPVISKFFGDSRLTIPLRVASLQILLVGFSNIPLAWMKRKFRYKVFAFIQLTSSLLMIVVSILSAMRGGGYWSYIAGILAGSAVLLVLSIVFLDWKPRFVFKFYWWSIIYKFSGFVLLEMIIGWFFVWFDNVSVAKHLGSDAAGVYALAFNLSSMAISLPISSITGVTLQTFSRMQNDMKSFRSTYLKGTGLIAAYAIPAGIGMSIIGSALIDSIYPGRWNDLGVILPILALYAGFGHLWILNTDAFKAIGKPEIMLKIYVPVLCVMLPVYWLFSQIGLFEFTVARSSIVLLGALPHTYFAIRYLGLKKDYLYHLVRAPLMASAGMAVLVWAGARLVTNLAILNRWLHLILLLAVIILGGLVYWLILRLLSPDFTRQIIDLFLRSIGVRKTNETS